DALIRTDNFRGGKAGSDDVTGLRLLSRAYFKGEVSEEKTDFTQNYRAAGTISQTALSFYVGDKRAADADAQDALIRTDNFRGGKAGSDDVTGLRLLSRAYFKGEVSEEKTDFTQNYRADGTISQTALSFYVGDKRAADADA